MNTVTPLKKTDYGYAVFFATALLLLAGMVFAAKSVSAATFSLLTAQLDYGQTSANVSNLQAFLASSSTIYPQGIVSGWFGPLTKSAVMNFQAAYGIPQAGRVGPQTLEKINSLIASGVALTGAGVTNNTTAPIIYGNSVSVNPSGNSVVVNWSTNEATEAAVYYSATPFQLMDTTAEFTRPSIVGGLRTSQTTSFQNSQSVTVSGLQSHTMYYYMIEAADTNSNFSYILPSTFTTN